MHQNVVSTGSTYRLYDESVRVFDHLPLQTYKVQFSPFSGFSLKRVDDLVESGEKVYGPTTKRIEKIIKTYRSINRSLGVLASGDKGMGKTMLLRNLASAVRSELGLPTVIVDEDYPGLADFLGTLGECVIVFDEFEKVFSHYPEDNQVQFLSLFDGMSSVKRMYVVTVNMLERVNDYLVNRPGRFHYHLRFEYPDDREITEYLTDHGVDAEQIDKVVVFAQAVNLNYDHLRAIAIELAAGYDFPEAISDLNVKQFADVSYSLVFSVDGKQYSSDVSINFGSRRTTVGFCAWSQDMRQTIYGELNYAMISRGPEGLKVPAIAVTGDDDEEDGWQADEGSVSLVLSRRNMIDF